METWEVLAEYWEIGACSETRCWCLVRPFQGISCLCLCVGSVVWERETESGFRHRCYAMPRLVALESWGELFEMKCNFEYIHFQDRRFNTIDICFLLCLGHEIVHTP